MLSAYRLPRSSFATVERTLLTLKSLLDLQKSSVFTLFLRRTAHALTQHSGRTAGAPRTLRVQLEVLIPKLAVLSLLLLLIVPALCRIAFITPSVPYSDDLQSPSARETWPSSLAAYLDVRVCRVVEPAIVGTWSSISGTFDLVNGAHGRWWSMYTLVCFEVRDKKFWTFENILIVGRGRFALRMPVEIRLIVCKRDPGTDACSRGCIETFPEGARSCCTLFQLLLSSCCCCRSSRNTRKKVLYPVNKFPCSPWWK